MKSDKKDLGIIGLAAMGSNLAMNFADHGFDVAIFNRSSERTDALVAGYGKDNGLNPFYSMESFVLSLKRPRKIILMIKAGEATDAVIDQLSGLLEEGDILVDGGNSFYRDTIRRGEILRGKGICYVGMGISGGEEGARRGPSLMPGVSIDSGEWKELEPMLTAIAAKDFDGNPCVAPIGSGGAGHFVKMVHNGIEYADMQFIAEAYWLLKYGLGLPNDSIAEVFAKWNEGRLQSYLIEITANILRTTEADGGYLIDRILDTAGAKGTGAWTVQEALTLGAPTMSITAAVFARFASANKPIRIKLAGAYPAETVSVADITVEMIENALYTAKVIAYAQGYELLAMAAKEYGWNLDLSQISRIWQGGCIIRAQFLRELMRVYGSSFIPEHLLLSSFAREAVRDGIEALRAVTSRAVVSGVSMPGFLSAISYFDTMRSAKLPANLLQAMRDYFGVHTFQREWGGKPEHFDWTDGKV